MAIIFDKDISAANLLLAYNNNIVRFHSDSPLAVLKAEITFFTFTKVLFPGPDGSFYFNFQEWISSIINTSNFADDLNLDIVADGYVYDWTTKAFLGDFLYFTIFYADTTNEQVAKASKWLSGFLQIETWKQHYPIMLDADKLFILSPFTKAANTKTYIKYWEGYPFDLSFYVPNVEQPLKAKNLTNLLTWDFENPFTITRLAFSDGNADTTIDDIISLGVGFNEMEFENNATKYYTIIEKIDATTCGNYVKWINEFGGWSYWLFYDAERTRTTGDLGELANDFYNLEDTTSPTIQIGKKSGDVIYVTSDTITSKEALLLEQLLDSPKVYLFTGIAFSKNSFNDWLEVTVKPTNIKIKQSKGSLNRFDLQIELPPRTTRTQ